MMAIFLDKIMQKENPNSKSRALIKEIKKIRPELIVSVFRYLSAKDTFEMYFTKYLSNRLI